MVATGFGYAMRHNEATHVERAQCLADAKAQCLADCEEGDLLDERCLRFRCFLELRFFPR